MRQRKKTFAETKLLSLPMLLLAAACQPVTDSDSINKVIASTPIEINEQESNFSAHWLTQRTLLLANADSEKSYRLAVNAGDEQQSIALVPQDMPSWIKEKHPHLKDFSAFSVSIEKDTAKAWLKHALYVFDASNEQAQAVAYVQTGEVIDDLYTKGSDDADEITDLGAVVKANQISIKLWAPTAQSVSVKLFNQDKTPYTTPSTAMVFNENSGTWTAELPKDTEGLFYQYDITVYHPATGQVENIVTTDPYSLSLSTNSTHTQIIDLNSDYATPAGWAVQQEPTLAAPEDAILYEVHVRDFSANDRQLSDEAHRGKYKAFTEKSSDAMNHVADLKAAGLNHIHLLPVFDIGTVNEEPGKAFDLQSTVGDICTQGPTVSVCTQELDNNLKLLQVLESFDPMTGDAQALVTELKTFDKYNWGYDPFHYTVPEGSYAINPDGTARIVEFKEMVQHLHNLGFRVIMDVVYNHTHKARLEETAVLDKIVPNYYQRLHPITGDIEQSTCCDNTATERVMMEKLMIDSLVVWARDYKIDGFRFDLMGHQPKAAMLKAREACARS